MDEYLRLVSETFATAPAPSQDSFARLIVLPAEVHSALQASVRTIKPPQYGTAALTKRIQDSSNGRVESLVAQRIAAVLSALLEYVSRCPPIAVLTSDSLTIQRSQYPSETTWKDAQQHWGTVFNRASSLFAIPTSSPVYFFLAFRYISSAFLTLSIRLDIISGQEIKFPHTTECTARLAGPVRASGTDRTPLEGSRTRRSAAMWLGNDCLRGYFRLNNLKLCETVLKSIREAVNRNRDFSADSERATGEEPYSMAERVRYRYYVGRIRISQGRVREGFTQLQWAFEHCPVTATAQLRRILLHLLPTVLVLGMRPRRDLVQTLCPPESEVGQLYLPLFMAYAKPDLAEFDRLLSERPRRERLRKLGVYVLLQEKCVAPMWRGLVKRCLVLSLPSAPSNPNAPPTLALSTLLKGARYVQALASRQPGAPADTNSEELDSTISDVDIECIVASLIDQGYIKGYTFHSKRLLVFQKGPSLGFPRVRDVY
ncbi:unnamed protein product [Parajaminaea phylloscopi]